MKKRPGHAQTMLAETEPPKLLPQVLSRLDLISLYFALIFGAYGAAQMAGKGWASIPILLIATVTFLLPCALAAYELGTLFPGEGGIYIWAQKTFGPIHGFISGWLSWVPIFLLLPLGATTIIAHLQVAFDANWPLWVQVVLQVAEVWIDASLAILGIIVSQRYIRWLSLVSFSTAVLIFWLAMVNIESIANPVTRDIFNINIFSNGALYSAAVLWLLGVEVPFNMGAEFRDHKRSAGHMLFWGTLALLLGYILGIVGILILTPVANIDSTTGVAKAAMGVAPIVGSILAIAIVFAVSSQGVAYMNAYSRLLFISGIERRLPKIFARLSDRKVPVPAIVAQALGASIVLLIFSTQTDLAVAFNLYLAALVAVWCVSLFYIYFGVIRARKMYFEQYATRNTEIWIIPGGQGGLYAVAITGIAFNCLAIYYVFAYPWVDKITPEAWRTWLFWLSAVIIILGVAIFRFSEGKIKLPYSSNDAEA